MLIPNALRSRKRSPTQPQSSLQSNMWSSHRMHLVCLYFVLFYGIAKVQLVPKVACAS